MKEKHDFSTADEFIAYLEGFRDALDSIRSVNNIKENKKCDCIENRGESSVVCLNCNTHICRKCGGAR